MVKEFIQACIDQDPVAQRKLYDKYAPVLYGCCLRYAPNSTEAQDVLQDSFITIYEKLEQFKGTGSFEGWLKRITVNTALMRYRQTQVYELVNQENIADEVDEVENLDGIALPQLLEMVQSLPDRYRLVFSMYALDGYSHNEIAQVLNISTGTSKSNLARARKNLKEKVQQWRIDNDVNLH